MTRTCILALCLAVCAAVTAAEPTLSAARLVDALTRGGCYVVMRHASSPRDPPSAETAAPGNSAHERQLDAAGKSTARAMGEALRRLKIPVAQVFSSPTWRAQETAAEAGLPKPTLVEQLGDRGQSMAATSDAQSAWLKDRVSKPVTGGNIILITHFPNLRAAFPDLAEDLADGEALVVRPESRGKFRFLGRVRIEEWPSFGK